MEGEGIVRQCKRDRTHDIWGGGKEESDIFMYVPCMSIVKYIQT